GADLRRPDALALVGAEVPAPDLAALRLGVAALRVGGVRQRHEAVAAADDLPGGVADAAELPRGAGAAPGAGVLHAAIDVVGHVHVHSHVVVLPERQVGDELPGVAAVVADADAAVLAGDQVAAVVGVDPQGVVVAVDVARAAQRPERLAGVVRDPQ